MVDVAAYKWLNGVPIEDLAREGIVIETGKQSAQEYGLGPESIGSFVQAQMDLAKAVQRNYFES